MRKPEAKSLSWNTHIPVWAIYKQLFRRLQPVSKNRRLLDSTMLPAVRPSVHHGAEKTAGLQPYVVYNMVLCEKQDILPCSEFKKGEEHAVVSSFCCRSSSRLFDKTVTCLFRRSFFFPYYLHFKEGKEQAKALSVLHSSTSRSPTSLASSPCNATSSFLFSLEVESLRVL